MVRGILSVAAVVLLAAGVTPARAANLEIQTGEVLLSRGGAYQAVRGVSEVVAGDTLVSRAGSAAKITFADGCVTYLGMGMVFTVEAKSPCETGRSSALETGATSPPSDATTAGAYDGWVEGTETLAVSEAQQTDFMPYLLGAAAVGGVVVAVAALGGGGGDSPPVSP